MKALKVYLVIHFATQADVSGLPANHAQISSRLCQLESNGNTLSSLQPGSTQR
jgi:hypothetical protein